MTLTHEDLERLWPEGPAFAYRAAVERLGEFADDTTCPATLPSAQQCWDVRHAVRGLLRIEAERLDNDRRVHGLDPRSWLLTSRPVTAFARIFLEGARR